MRENVTAVQYQRWKVAEEHRQIGDAERANNADFKRAHDEQVERHIEYGRANKEKNQEQLEHTRQSVEANRTQKRETGDALRLRLGEMAVERQAFRDAWADRGRNLVKAKTARAGSAKRAQVHATPCLANSLPTCPARVLHLRAPAPATTTPMSPRMLPVRTHRTRSASSGAETAR